MHAETSLDQPQRKIKDKKIPQGTYVQYGCGFSAPDGWTNFDASPTLRLQKAPFIGALLRKKLNVVFPENVKYGDITKGLPNIKENSCDGVYCSHVLEHLSLNDFRIALKQTFSILKPGAIFRCVVPDLEFCVREYIAALEDGDPQASTKFIGNYILMGTENRPKNMKGYVTAVMGNANHLWMWDNQSMAFELKKAGFREIRKCSFNDSEDSMFKLVEASERFENAVAYECIK